MANKKRLERLTLPHLGGKGHYMKCSEQFGCDGLCGNCDELDKLVDRLAYYEDKAEKTVDAVEVVHGEWEIIEDDYYDLVELKCSVCGASYGFEDYEDDTPKNYHYCPNCGAKMDGDGNEID